MKKEPGKEPTVQSNAGRQTRSRATLLISAALVSLLLSLSAAHAQANSQPTGFEFYFRGAAPGMRVWTRDRDTWTETYSNGQKDTFRVKTAPFRHNGVIGTLVQKVTDRQFFVFIPNIGSQKMEVWTYQGKGPWRFLAKMKEVRPGGYIY